MKTEIDKQVDELEYQIQEIKGKVAELRRQRPREEIQDYQLLDCDGQKVSLSSLFGNRSRMILVHNMGRHCSYCTMWADGFVGLVPHLSSRAAFVVTSPDEPAVQKEFARSRGWNFPMYSVAGTSLTTDLGFEDPEDGLMPGVSILTREADGRVYRASRAEFGPGDDFCSVWHFFDLLPEGIDGWEPQFNYELLQLSCAH